MAVTLASRLFISSASFALSLMRAGYTTGLGLASDLKALIVAASERAAGATGMDKLLGGLVGVRPMVVLLIQFLSLASCLVILGVLAHSRHWFHDGDRTRLVVVGILWVIAFGSLGIAILGFPPRYVLNDLSSLSGLEGREMAFGPEASVLTITLPRDAEVVVSRLDLTSRVELGTGILLEIPTASGREGVSVSQLSQAAFGFVPNSSVALRGFSCLVSAVESSTQALELYGYSGSEAPSGEPLFQVTTVPEGVGLQATWVEFRLGEPFLALGGQRLWIVLTTAGEGHYAWWRSASSEGQGMTLVRGSQGRWSRVSGDLCFSALRSPSYGNEILVGTGRMEGYWRGSVPTDGTVSLDLAGPLSDYLALSPENFKEVDIPITATSEDGAQVLVARLELLVRQPNPEISFGFVSLLLAVLVGTVCVYGVIRLQRSPGSPSGFGEPLPEPRMPLSAWKPIE